MFYLRNNIISGGSYSGTTGIFDSDNNLWRITPPVQYNEGPNSIVYPNWDSMFVNRSNRDYRPLMSSPACNGSINPAGVAVGALPCVSGNGTSAQNTY